MWLYSNWPSQTTVALQLSQLNLHIQEVTDEQGSAAVSADGKSRTPKDHTSLLTYLFRERDRLLRRTSTGGFVSKVVRVDED